MVYRFVWDVGRSIECLQQVCQKACGWHLGGFFVCVVWLKSGVYLVSCLLQYIAGMLCIILSAYIWQACVIHTLICPNTSPGSIWVVNFFQQSVSLGTYNPRQQGPLPLATAWNHSTLLTVGCILRQPSVLFKGEAVPVSFLQFLL